MTSSSCSRFAVHITLRPNGYVVCAVLAGLLAGGWTGDVLELVALWVLADIAVGAWHAGLVHGAAYLPWARGERQLAPGDLLGAACGAALAVLIAGRLGDQAGFITRAALGMGVVLALAAARQPQREAAPALTGLQVTLAWILGLARTGPWPSPWVALGLVAGIGVSCRLRHSLAPSHVTRWGTRIAWAAWVVLLLAVRQPLLAGLVAITSLADDLRGVAPRRWTLSEGLVTLGWVGTWLLAAIAVSHWRALG